jgi:hypothetical protein
MGCEADLSRNARMAVPLREVRCAARRPPPDYVVPVCRIQVQPGLLVLLVLR